MTEEQIKLIIQTSIEKTHEYSEYNVDDEINIDFIEINGINYAIYIRYNDTSCPLLFLLNIETMKVIEIDHGLRGGPFEIKSENEYILMKGRFLGQGDGNQWYKYSIDPPHIVFF